MRESFLLHKDSLSILDKMTNEQAGIFIKAIYYYQKTETIPELDFALEMAITPFVNQFKRDNEKYNVTVEKRKVAGAKGGNQKQANVAIATNSYQTVANVADSDNVNDNVNDNDSVSDNEKKEEEKEKNSTSTFSENQIPDFIIEEQKKITPHVAPPPFLDLEAIEDKMRYSQMLSESVRRSNKINDSEFNEALEEFFLEQRAIGKEPKNESDHKKHFISWARIWAVKQKQNPNTPKKGKLENLSNQHDRIMKQIEDGIF